MARPDKAKALSIHAEGESAESKRRKAISQINPEHYRLLLHYSSRAETAICFSSEAFRPSVNRSHPGPYPISHYLGGGPDRAARWARKENSRFSKRESIASDERRAVRH